MNAPNSGYGLMRNADILNEAYRTSPFAKDASSWLPKLRAATGASGLRRYGGIGRYPLNADYRYIPPGWQGSDAEFVEQDTEAMISLGKALGIIEGKLPEEDWLIDGPWLIPELHLARDIMRISTFPDQLEIVEVAKFPTRTVTPPIGFDIGYWASGNFSLICDVFVWPLWHPADPSDYEKLREWMPRLNQRYLFDTEQDALEFREFYRSRDWAEFEPNNTVEFIIIEVAEVE